MSVTYVSTRIVSWDANTITLRTGGWGGVTMRRKMNQASYQFRLGFVVYRRKGITYVRTPHGAEHVLTDTFEMARLHD
jgi:hypothetical protein